MFKVALLVSESITMKHFFFITNSYLLKTLLRHISLKVTFLRQECNKTSINVINIIQINVGKQKE